MRTKGSRAATAATAPMNSANAFYHRASQKSTIINEILARLLFALASPNLTSVERTGIVSLVDQLVRLKVDLRLLKGMPHE